MADVKHTPGPWGVRDNKPKALHFVDSRARFWVITSADNFGPALVPAWDDKNGEGSFEPEEARANARLIAAAPTLLEALEAVRETGSVDVSGTALIFDDLPEMEAMIDAAIALAKGEKVDG